MDNQKQELIKKLKESNNILVTVSANPSVDQLAACIGLTLFLNKQKKHATAVFSGEVPSTLQFLKPADTLEKNTDSLRDFIVSLDKSKADKLRYKVEDNVVKIFITPYKTSITEADLDFSQGDFNVDVVLCLGVDKQQDLDQAITSHGRILHDATVACVGLGSAGELGTLNWIEPQASSLSELAAQITDALGKEEMDGQIATSFLTGIVAETERFSNDKTSPVTMKLSANLMAAGANQQLVASELDAGKATLAINEPVPETETVPTPTDGTLEIGHAPEASSPTPEANPNEYTDTDNAPDQAAIAPLLEGDGQTPGPASRLVLQPPSFGGTLTANSMPESFDPSVDPLSLMSRDTSMLQHNDAQSDEPAQPETDQQPGVADKTPEQNMALPTVQPPSDTSSVDSAPRVDDILPDFEPLPSEPGVAPTNSSTDSPDMPPASTTTDSERSRTDLDQAAEAPAGTADPTAAVIPEEGLDAARDAVMSAITAQPTGLPEPTQASGAAGYLNVQDLPGSTRPDTVDPNAAILTLPDIPDTHDNVAPLSTSPADTPLTMPTPPTLTIPPVDPTPPTSTSNDPGAPPPVPPPLPLDDLSKFTNPK